MLENNANKGAILRKKQIFFREKSINFQKNT